jgi:hypothetical protein
VREEISGPLPWLRYVAMACGGIMVFIVGVVIGSCGSGTSSQTEASKSVAPVMAKPPPEHAAIKPEDDNGSGVTASTSAASADPAVRADGGLDYLSLKEEAEAQLKAKLTDDHGVRYRNVQTRLSTLDGGGIVAFCGEENSRSPMGGYGGWRRFIASRSTATTEDGMTSDDFETAWGQFCSGGVVGPKVWF